MAPDVAEPRPATMRPVRRVLGVLAATLVAVGAVVIVPPAQAQGSDVTLQILRQSPWSSAYHRSLLTIDLLAYNGGAGPLDDLRIEVSFGPHVESRGDYATVLTTGPDTTIASVTEPVRGEVGPGNNRTIEVSADLATTPGIDQTDSQTYPAVVQLLTGDTVLASLVTPVIYLVRPPEAPMLSATWVQLPSPIAFGADGTLVDTGFPGELAHGGTLRAPLDAVANATVGRHPHGPMDLVVDPLLVTQARDLFDGYRTRDGTEVASDTAPARQAGSYLRSLSTVVSSPGAVETVANPYANPLLPAMLQAQLTTLLAGQRLGGDEVLSSLGAEPASNIAKPADGQLSDDALSWLAGVGTGIVLGDADTVDRSAAQGFLAPAPTVPMPTAGGTLTMVLPDPDTQALFERADLLADPVRAAQIVLGELAVIWKEAPVPSAPIVRGIAIAPPPTLPVEMWDPLLQRVSEAPFLEPVTAAELVARISAPEPEPRRRAGRALERGVRYLVCARDRRAEPQRRGVRVDARPGQRGADRASSQAVHRHRAPVRDGPGRGPAVVGIRRCGDPGGVRRRDAARELHLHVHLARGNDPDRDGRPGRHAAAGDGRAHRLRLLVPERLQPERRG